MIRKSAVFFYFGIYIPNIHITAIPIIMPSHRIAFRDSRKKTTAARTVIISKPPFAIGKKMTLGITPIRKRFTTLTLPINTPETIGCTMALEQTEKFEGTFVSADFHCIRFISTLKRNVIVMSFFTASLYTFIPSNRSN